MISKNRIAVVATLGVVVFAWFVWYPEDLEAVLAPVATALKLSQAPSPWLYLVIGVGIASWTIVRVAERRQTPR